jgi:hypothetical protein
MKNTLKLGALALALAVSFASCAGNKSTSATDSTKVTDTTKKDSAKLPPPDTSKKPADTTKKK